MNEMTLDQLIQRFERIEAWLQSLQGQRVVKEWYSTDELFGKRPFTVREWCRLGRVHARKREHGRGLTQEWILSHAELARIRNERLQPLVD